MDKRPGSSKHAARRHLFSSPVAATPAHDGHPFSSSPPPWMHTEGAEGSADAVERQARTRASVRNQRSFEASRASRLLDVSPPNILSSMSGGLTSDSDAAGPVSRRKDVSPLAPRPRLRDAERDAGPPASDTDEWDFPDAPDSDVPQAGPSSQSWAPVRNDKVGCIAFNLIPFTFPLTLCSRNIIPHSLPTCRYP